MGPAFDLSPHFNVACTVALALEGALDVRFWHPKSGWGEWHSSTAALIPSQTIHHMLCRGRMLFVYFDPRCDDVSGLTNSNVLAARTYLVQAGVSGIDLQTIADALGIKAKPQASPRILRALQMLESSPNEFQTIDDAAEIACLSVSRFRALFAKQIGVPFRRYRLWRRMALVMQALQAGDSLTEAALRAGFYDSAHLSASFKEMFGISPSTLLGRGIQIRTEHELESFTEFTASPLHAPLPP
nr:AraC family transcriptional regulator [Limnobacter parvus]